jgi:hypothetical protein
MEYCNRIVAQLERKILNIHSRSENAFEKIEMGITYSQQCLRKLRIKIGDEGFLTVEAECHFFKHIKPKALGFLIFFLNLAEFEMGRPNSTVKKAKNHILNSIAQYQNYFREHTDFYLYLKRNRTDRDMEYFLRAHGKVKFHPDALAYCIDDEFSTSHDFIAAKIFAHNLLIEHLNNELISLNQTSQSNESQRPSNMLWTGTKTDLIELMYAIHETGAINNGHADIKDLADFFQQILNIDLGEYYRAYIEIRSRKINQTKFLDCMKKNLQKRMAEADQ